METRDEDIYEDCVHVTPHCSLIQKVLYIDTCHKPIHIIIVKQSLNFCRLHGLPVHFQFVCCYTIYLYFVHLLLLCSYSCILEFFHLILHYKFIAVIWWWWLFIFSYMRDICLIIWNLHNPMVILDTQCFSL